MVERRTELDRRYRKKKKMKALKAKLPTAGGADREAILAKIKRISPWWTEAALKPATAPTGDAATKDEAPKEPKKKAPPKPKADKKPA